ncbi:AAA family ATPase [Dysgonomonas macrotermitis]|uniref:AAA domain-containing protein n=1 Tax=Dysgonomonas macrotermitis TaxID=1346286 RepID=A0A1M4SDD3_9BACT|nr:AAA family ATPase [Dysgonomonas macrotermitis]SHE30206.1 AAA domain-containing protein [Dysgonomonas macrotermitis]
MKLIIRQLALLNFKGLRDYILNPAEHITNVHATNGAGKSTICDAWSWLWTGKDAKGRADYEIKTLDENNEAIHHLEHTVSVNMDVDYSNYKVSRTFKEKWVKPTGEEERKLDTHTTTFIWDGIPLTLKKDFDQRTNQLFGSSEQFHLLSNPRFFLNMEWQKRRKLLMELAGVTDDAILSKLSATSTDFAKLIEELGKNNLDDFRKKLNAEKKTLKSKIDEIPIKIREATLAIPEEPDYMAVEESIKSKGIELSAIDLQLSDISKAYEGQAEDIKKQQSVILEKERRLAAIKSDTEVEVDRLNKDQNKEFVRLQNELTQLENLIRSLNSDQALIITKIHNKESEIESQKELLTTLRSAYGDLNAIEMHEDDKHCPSCGAELLGEKLDNAVEKFNADKAQKLQANIAKGKREKEVLDSLITQLEELKRQKDAIIFQLSDKAVEAISLKEAIEVEGNKEKQHLVASDLLEKNAEYQRLVGEVYELKKQRTEIQQPDTTELRQKKALISRDIDELKKLLYIKTTAETQKKRIQDLDAELKKLSQELATLEGKEFIADKFNRAKIEAIENGINGLFATIKWKMFKPLMTGGEEECCEALIDGTPYQAANNAAQINAGIECINTLSKHFDMYLPIFVDNAESVVELIPSESQIIRFVVDESCDKLTLKENIKESLFA